MAEEEEGVDWFGHALLVALVVGVLSVEGVVDVVLREMHPELAPGSRMVPTQCVPNIP